MAVLYRHIRLDKNEPFYIGIGNSKHRAGKKDSRNSIWHNIVAKSPYRVDIIMDNLTWQEACEKEIEFIALYGRKDLKNGTLVNMTDGGEGCLNVIKTEESKIKISIAKTGVKQTKEAIENRLAARLKLNYKHSDEVKKKISNTKREKGSPRSKVVLNFSTGIFYNSAQEASDLLSIPLITVYRLCKGQAKNMLNNLKYV